MSRVNFLQDDPAMVADLYIGVDMMQRAFELEPTYYASSPMVAMAAYHGRTADAEVKQARALFEQALKNTKRGALTSAAHVRAVRVHRSRTRNSTTRSSTRSSRRTIPIRISD